VRAEFSTLSWFVFVYECNGMAKTSIPTSRVENLAQVLSCWLKFVYDCNSQIKGSGGGVESK
jgi:hypothetical protein